MDGEERIPADSQLGEGEAVKAYLSPTEADIGLEPSRLGPEHDEERSSSDIARRVAQGLSEVRGERVTRHPRLPFLKPLITLPKIRLHVGI